jgi:hypothetical protein
MYHKYPADFKMMREMGIKHYRCESASLCDRDSVWPQAHHMHV